LTGELVEKKQIGKKKHNFKKYTHGTKIKKETEVITKGKAYKKNYCICKK
jgi:hypothetical protein